METMNVEEMKSTASEGIQQLKETAQDAAQAFMEADNITGRIILFSIAGAMLGAALAFITSPGGEQVRQRLGSMFGGGDMEKGLEPLTEKAKSVFDQGRHLVEQGEEIVHALQEGVHRVEDIIRH